MVERKYYNCYAHQINTHSARLGNDGVGCSKSSLECDPDNCSSYKDAQMTLRKL